MAKQQLLRQQIETIARWIIECGHLVAFTGAGISTDSGIPDFRGPDGVWTRRDAGMVPPRWLVSPGQIQPNESHLALVELQRLVVVRSTSADRSIRQPAVLVAHRDDLLLDHKHVREGDRSDAPGQIRAGDKPTGQSAVDRAEVFDGLPHELWRGLHRKLFVDSGHWIKLKCYPSSGAASNTQPGEVSQSMTS